MKKILTLVFALLLSIGVSAQTQLTEAVNFEATAHNGEEIELFDILDGGQYALIYFYYSTGPAPVKDYVAKLVDAYYSLGCNSEDIYFMEISPEDHAKSTDEWISTYKVPFPTIHKETEGDTGDSIAAKYQIKNFNVFESNGFENVKDSYDYILINPPIRAGKEVIFKMFEDSIKYLKKDGILMIVIRKDQGAPSAKKKLSELYGNCETLDREKGYHILVSKKI
jgi:hypothetical protein